LLAVSLMMRTQGFGKKLGNEVNLALAIRG